MPRRPSGPRPFASPVRPLPSPRTAAVRVCAYAWAAPTTLLGLAIIAATGARCRIHHGVIEAEGPRLARALDGLPVRRGIVAMTLGHVVLGRDRTALDETREHERVHVAQCERWGLAFVPAYLLASAAAWWRGADAYRDNPFERAAYEATPAPCSDITASPLGHAAAPVRPRAAT